MKKIYIFIILFLFSVLMCTKEDNTIKTEITKWLYGKEACISLTYDDGTITQFRVALPMMDERGFPATFFINTGSIPGSKYKPKFVGRPLEEIVKETEKVPTNKDNCYERASAISFLGYRNVERYQSRAASYFQRGRFEEAFKNIDEFYTLVRNGKLEPIKRTTESRGQRKYKPLTWDEIREIAANGHEFAVHTVSHAYLSAMDEANILYEIGKCREDIEIQLGKKHTFSIECPYGINDDRVLEYVFPKFPLSRNRLTDEFVFEIHRGSSTKPESPDKEYIQWQRGPHTDTPMETMKEWVDTSIMNNVWLVLVFHGINDMGWEAKTEKEIEEYFNYIKSKEDKIWVATFQDAGKYMRERMNGNISSKRVNNTIKVELTHSLDPDLYNLPLTLKTYVPSDWNFVQINQGTNIHKVKVNKNEMDSYVLYEVLPNFEIITINESD